MLYIVSNLDMGSLAGAQEDLIWPLQHNSFLLGRLGCGTCLGPVIYLSVQIKQLRIWLNQ